VLRSVDRGRMKFACLLLIAALTGCTTAYDWGVDVPTGRVYLKGTHPVFDSQKALEAVDTVNAAAINTVGAAARGYAAGAEEYQETHPYVQPAPLPQSHMGTIVGPDGQMSSYYSNGNSTTIYGPNGTTRINGN
jgi:hypothetical protein